MNGFFGVGPLEMLLIAVLALIFIGPQRLPGVIQQVMRTVRELRAYASQIQDELSGEFADVRAQLDEITRDVSDVAQDFANSANEIATEANNAAALIPSVTEMTALPPREAPAYLPELPSPAAVGANGATHDADESPAFQDYRPG